MKKFLQSAVMGVLALLLVNLSSCISGISLSVNLLSLSVSSVFGVSGVITMLIMGYIIN